MYAPWNSLSQEALRAKREILVFVIMADEVGGGENPNKTKNNSFKYKYIKIWLYKNKNVLLFKFLSNQNGSI